MAAGIAQAAHVGYAESWLLTMLLLRISNVPSVRLNVITSPARQLLEIMIHFCCYTKSRFWGSKETPGANMAH